MCAGEFCELRFQCFLRFLDWAGTFNQHPSFDLIKRQIREILCRFTMHLGVIGLILVVVINYLFDDFIIQVDAG